MVKKKKKEEENGEHSNSDLLAPSSMQLHLLVEVILLNT